MTKNTEANRRIVERFVEEVPVRGNHALDELVAEDYVQHNPQAGQGRTGVREFFANLEQFLGDELDPTGDLQVNLIAEGDFVVRHHARERHARRHLAGLRRRAGRTLGRLALRRRSRPAPGF
ncbi:MAG: nuclear transport factor 2 family protein [Leucobacter sp.]